MEVEITVKEFSYINYINGNNFVLSSSLGVISHAFLREFNFICRCNNEGKYEFRNLKKRVNDIM